MEITDSLFACGELNTETGSWKSTIASHRCSRTVKPLIVLYPSDSEAIRSKQEPHDIRLCCAELTYLKDTKKYYLSVPGRTRAGLLWPVCGAEIGTWIRRYKKDEETLAHRKDKHNARLKLKIAVSASNDALLVLCPAICKYSVTCLSFQTLRVVPLGRLQSSDP